MNFPYFFPRLVLGRIPMFLLLAGLLSAKCAMAAEAVADRPEKLSFKPLSYEPPNPADYRVKLKTGTVAYVVPDHELPLVTISVILRPGWFVVEPGDEGIAHLAGSLMTRSGAGTRTAEQLDERIDFLAASLASGIAETHGTVRLNLLSKDLDEGLALLRDVLTAPRFQQDRVDLEKQQLLQGLRQRNDDSSDIETRERRFLSYGEDFWINHHATAQSVTGIDRAKLEAFHKKWIHPANFIVAASGDFEREAMVRKLEQLFGDWPYQGTICPKIPDNPVFSPSGVYLVNKDVNQGRVSVVLPGIQQDKPDFFAVMMMNEILGGGAFTSRITSRVRSDEGLAYDASSVLAGGIFFPGTFVTVFQSKSRTVAYAASLVLEELKRITAEPVAAEELNTAQKSFIDTFPRNFGSKSQVAELFAQDELTGRYARDPEYWKKFRARVAAVTAQDVLEASKKYLSPEKLVILVIGQKNEILQGHPDHPVKLQTLAGERFVELPMRDPMTMKPVKN